MHRYPTRYQKAKKAAQLSQSAQALANAVTHEEDYKFMQRILNEILHHEKLGNYTTVLKLTSLLFLYIELHPYVLLTSEKFKASMRTKIQQVEEKAVNTGPPRCNEKEWEMLLTISRRIKDLLDGYP